MDEFVTDIKILQDRAQRTIEKGPITDAAGTDLERVYEVLNQVLAAEMACVRRYKRHFFSAEELDAPGPSDEFLAYAVEESEHADLISARIEQLGGRPDLAPEVLSGRPHPDATSLSELFEQVQHDVIAERAVISIYREVIDWLGAHDPATRRLLEGIVANEEEHVEDMLDLIADAV